MWTTEVSGKSSAPLEDVFAALADVASWPEWNAGVREVRMAGPFAAGTAAVMVFPDGSELPFSFAWVDPERGFEDVTPVPGTGVTVRVRHELVREGAGTRITYRAIAEGPDETAAEIGAGASEDFAEVIAALAARAEARSA